MNLEQVPMPKDEQFVSLFRENYDRIYNLAVRMQSDRIAAQDLTQDIFLKIYNNLENYRGKSNPGTWIYSIAVNHCIDFLRRERSYPGRLQRLFFERKEPPKDSEDRIIDKSLGMEILRKLSPTNRALMILKLYLQLDYEQIGSIMKLTPASVGVQLTRARKEALKIAEGMGLCDEV